jgi:mono/diheme cytochrome c family protein
VKEKIMKRNLILFGGLAIVALAFPGADLQAGEAKAGKAAYDKLCASCHGPDGKGNPAMVKAMGEKGLNIATKETAEKKDDELVKVIVEGKGKMPAAGKGLSKTEQKQLLDYTRSLAQ